MKAKNADTSGEQNHVHARKPVKQTKIMKEQQFLIRNEASEQRLHLVPEAKPKKHSGVKQVALSDASPINDRARKKTSYTRHSLTPISTPVSDLNYRGIIHVRKEASVLNMASILGRNQNERLLGANDAAIRRSIAAFDLNQDSDPSVKEASLPSRAPIFDLNEISVGIFVCSVKFQLLKVLMHGVLIVISINRQVMRISRVIMKQRSSRT